MKVCLLGNSSDVPVRQLVRFLIQGGHEVHLLCFGPLDYSIPVPVHSIGGKRASGFLAAYLRASKIITRLQPDLVHAFYLTSYGFFASAVSDIPVLVSAKGTDVFGAPQHSPLLRPLRRALVRHAIRRADWVHSVAEHMTVRLRELGADSTRVTTFPFGVSLEQFRPRMESKRPNLSYRFLCNRKLEPVYDYSTLLEGTALLTKHNVPFQLRIIANGFLKSGLVAQAVHLGIADRVSFEKEVNHEEMPGILAETDLFITASYSDGTSSSLLEALAVGCVPVATDIPANRYWIRDGENGFLFIPGDPGSLAAAIEKALEALERWPAIQSQNREQVTQRGSLADGCRKLLEIYCTIIRARTR
jgi:L-malate glycosyltransferase